MPQKIQQSRRLDPYFRLKVTLWMQIGTTRNIQCPSFNYLETEVRIKPNSISNIQHGISNVQVLTAWNQESEWDREQEWTTEYPISRPAKRDPARRETSNRRRKNRGTGIKLNNQYPSKNQSRKPSSQEFPITRPPCGIQQSGRTAGSQNGVMGKFWSRTLD